MVKVVALVLFLFSVLPGNSRAQQTQLLDATPSATADASTPTIFTSAVTGTSYIIEARAARGGIRPASTRGATTAASPAAAPPSRLEGLTPDQLGILEKLNRVNASRLTRIDAVVIPAEWRDDELAYSPFPQTYDWASDKPQTIVVDQIAQAFAAYEYGRLVRWGPVSSGQGGKTPSGVFTLSWRSRGHRSSIDPSWYLEWYFNFIPSRGIAFHKYSLPGHAASHGCVRMLERDARWLYTWGTPKSRGESGTTVLVLNCPDSAKAWQTGEFLTSGVTLPADPQPGMRSCTGYAGASAASYRKAIR